MKNNWYYNNPYMHMIVADALIPVFMSEGQACIPIFSEYEYAQDFSEKYLLKQNTKILTVSMLDGIRFLENILKANHFILQIGIYNKALMLVNSKEFIKEFYEYKQSYGEILNELVENKTITKDTLITLIANAPLYVLTNSEVYKDDGYVVTVGLDGKSTGMKYVKAEDNLSFFKNESKITLFTSKKEFEKYKLKNNNSMMDIKEYLYVEDLLKYLEHKEVNVNFIEVNPGGINYIIDINEIAYCLTTLNSD